MANFLYVDNSNVWIEGMRVSAVAQGMAPDIYTAMQGRITDYRWKLDFGKLFSFAGGEREDVACARLYGSRPPKNDSLWDVARNKGFDPIIHDRNAQNKEKKIDVNVATDMIADSYEHAKKESDEFTLVAGDRDFVPTIEHLRNRGFTVEVAFWDHAAVELKNACSKFINLDPYLEHLRLK